MTWLTEDRADAAAGRILDAAEELFGHDGVSAVGMDAVARAAGCSRATLYRYFSNRHALLTAYADREARRVVEKASAELAAISDPQERATSAVLACLREVRARPHLAAWYTGDPSVLVEVLRESPFIDAFAARSISDPGGEPDLDLAHWVLRAIVSFLTAPGADEDEEERLVRRFLSPFLTVE